MGRLSAYAKNRILKLRFKKNKRIIHIVEILKRDDNIKVSRQAVSTFLKKYLETNSIYDKPRTGRKRKLTPEEIQLIGQVTRLNRDITARAIKEYLNLNVSTYTILRATKLFEWNKVNLNSNEAKRQLAAEKKKTPLSGAKKSNGKVKKNAAKDNSLEIRTDVDEDDEEKKQQNDNNSDYLSTSQLSSNNEMVTLGEDVDQDYDSDESGEVEKIQPKHNLNGAGTLESPKEVPKKPRITAHSIPDFEKVDLQLLCDKELMALKNLSCSPMSFATKILFKIFKEEELHGHNVSGKTLNRNIKAKLPLDPLRVGYIKFLVEAWYDESEYKEMLTGANNKQDLWKSCHTAINKSILISERKAMMAKQQPKEGKKVVNGSVAVDEELNGDEQPAENGTTNGTIDTAPVTSPKSDSKKNNDVYEFQNGADDESDEDFETNKKKRKVPSRKRATAIKKTVAASKRQRRYKSSEHGSSSEDDEEAFDSIGGESDSDYDENSSCSSGDDGQEGSLPLHMDEELEARIRQYKAKQQSLGATTTNFRRNLDTGTPNKKSTTNGSSKQSASGRKTRQAVAVSNVSDSSEALAAANIAASMKKRLVVVSDINDSIGNGSVPTVASPDTPPAKPSKTTPKRTKQATQPTDTENQLNSSSASPTKSPNGKESEPKQEPQEEPEPTNIRSARSSPKTTTVNTKLLNTSQTNKIQTRSSNRISSKK